MNNSNVESLLYRSFSGDLSEEEAAVLQEWLSASPQNRRVSELYKQLWDNASRAQLEFPDLDLNSAFSKTMDKANRSKVQLSFWYNPFVRTAAAAALVIGVFFTYKYFNAQNNTVIVLAEKGGYKKEVTLPDGSKVWLREYAQLSYPGQWGKTRSVTLSGEAFFDVQPDQTKPFVITTQTGKTVEVVGTSFEVSDSYTATTVTVASGRVKVMSADKNVASILTSGQTALVSDKKVDVSAESNINEYAWKTEKFVFDNAPLSKVFDDLQKNFGVRINVNKNIRNCSYSARFDNKTVDQILNAIAITHHLTITKEGDNSYQVVGVCN
jgi:transmembrane sensor